jgi:hypothetical protein
LGKIGNVFHTKEIEKAIELGQKYNVVTKGAMSHSFFELLAKKRTLKFIYD